MAKSELQEPSPDPAAIRFSTKIIFIGIIGLGVLYVWSRGILPVNEPSLLGYSIAVGTTVATIGVALKILWEESTP